MSRRSGPSEDPLLSSDALADAGMADEYRKVPPIEEAYNRLRENKTIFSFALNKIGRPQLLLLCGMVVSVMCGTTNAFAPTARNIENSTTASNNLLTVYQSVGMVGLYFTIPAGWSNDTLGPFPTCFCSALLAAGGYMLASFAAEPGFWALGLGLGLTGFGSGGMFISVLASVIKSRPNHAGSGIGLVGACMSLSMAFTSVLLMAYDGASGCEGDPCWRAHLRYLAVCCGAVLIPGSFCVRYLTATVAEEESITGYGTSGKNPPLLGNGNSNRGTAINGGGGGGGVVGGGGSGPRDVVVSAGKDMPVTPQTPRLTSYQSGAAPVTPGDRLGSYETPQRVAFLDLDAPSPILARPDIDDGGDCGSSYKRGYADDNSNNNDKNGDTDVVVMGIADDHIEGDDDDSSVMSDMREKRSYSQSAHASTVVSMMVSLRVFRHPYFWALFITYFAGIGGGIIIIANYKLWIEFAPDANFGNTLNIAFSTVNCTGTVVAGLLSDHLMKARGIPRARVLSAFLAYGGLNMLGMSVLIMHPGLKESYTLQVILLVLHINGGVTFGSIFSLLPALCGDTYGPINFGKYFSYLQLGSTSSLLIPIAASNIQEKYGNFFGLYMGLGALQVLSAGLVLIPAKEYMG